MGYLVLIIKLVHIRIFPGFLKKILEPINNGFEKNRLLLVISKNISTVIDRYIFINLLKSLLSHECLNKVGYQYFILKLKNKIYLQKLNLN